MNIINLKDLEFAGFPGGVPEPQSAKFGGVMGQVGMKLGTKKVGINVTVCEPGKAVFPFHSHRVNEELFYILEGTGELRLGKDTHPVKVGDFIFCPPGGAETAHQLRNTGASDLKYIAMSSKDAPEIAEYPDSGKFGVLTSDFRFLGRVDESLGYWEGE